MIGKATTTATRAEGTAPLIELRGLTRVFEEGDQRRAVLERVDGSIAHGEFVALLGRSGSGKSTLLNLISGIDQPTSGEVLIDGRSMTRLSEHERTLFRRRHIGFIFQFFNLIPTLTVEENLLLPLELNGHTSKEQRREALGLLAQVGLADRARAFPDRLSGGEQQRVAIARALAHNPLLVLADEPTGNLDAETSQQILNLLDRLVRQAGKTMVVVTHSQEVAALADRVLSVEHGRLVERALEVAR